MSHTKESIELLDFTFDLANALEASKKDDGKINWKDAPKFVGVVWKAPAAIGGIQNIPAELSVHNPGGKEEVLEFLRNRFDLADDELEALYEDTVTAMAGLGAVLERWLDRRHPKAA